ncbi:MAG: (2Fe-2S) ferredoxin domain-containing protein [Nostocaceae cyanobacterium]|nr:(2Fe-2S) ferredoxin domain-containing protein [Nostocaceae cyanobacterium]
MSKFNSIKVANFCLEGQLVDFVIKDGYKLKGLYIKTPEGEIYIKLAKYLRAAFDLRLQPGTWLQIVGEKKIDLKTGNVKLKAERVLAAGAKTELAEIAEVGGGVSSSFVLGNCNVNYPEDRHVQDSSTASKTKPAQGKATILVCQKSDCMKRGAKGVCQALSAALSDRGLSEQVTIKGTGCMKNCKGGPNVVMPDKTRYSRIQAEQIPAVMNKHFPDTSQEEQQDMVATAPIPVVSMASIASCMASI